MRIINLNIHNFLKIQIRQTYAFELIKDINQPFSYFETNDIDEPDIIFNIGNFKEQHRDSKVIDHKVFIREDYIYCSEKAEGVAFKIEIFNLETKPTVVNVHVKAKKFRQYLFPALLAQNIFLRPLIDFKLQEKDIFSVHGACVSDKTGAIVFAGRGGCFKTSLCMDLVRKHGFNFLSDDRILIRNNNVYCFPIHYRLFNFRVSKMSSEYYAKFDKLKYLASQMVGTQKEIQIVNSAAFRKILSLVKKTRRGFERHFIRNDELIRKILNSQMMENLVSPKIMGISMGKFYEYLAAYSYVFPESRTASYWKNYANLGKQYIKADEVQEVCLPNHYSEQCCNSIVEILS